MCLLSTAVAVAVDGVGVVCGAAQPGRSWQQWGVVTLLPGVHACLGVCGKGRGCADRPRVRWWVPHMLYSQDVCRHVLKTSVVMPQPTPPRSTAVACKQGRKQQQSHQQCFFHDCFSVRLSAINLRGSTLDGVCFHASVQLHCLLWRVQEGCRHRHAHILAAGAYLCEPGRPEYLYRCTPAV
jgi:hypothetical protein